MQFKSHCYVQISKIRFMEMFYKTKDPTLRNSLRCIPAQSKPIRIICVRHHDKSC